MKRKTGDSLHSSYKSMEDDAIVLKILEIVETTPKVSQRKIVGQTGLAASLVHSFMRRVINKGWVKTRQVSAKRWLYYLTPEGFVEKGKLTISYLSHTLSNYRQAQERISGQLDLCLENGWRRLVIAGDGDLGEITLLNVKSRGEFELAGVLTDQAGDSAKGLPVQGFEAVKEMKYDKILVCDVKFLYWWQDHFQDNSDLLVLNLDGWAK